MMKKNEVEKYKNYPEGSSSKKSYDRYFLTMSEYLEKYYKNPEFKEWDSWNQKYIEPAFDENRHDEFIKNFGYVDKKYHDFVTQDKVYQQLTNDNRLTNEIRQFIGFLAGADEGIFFKQYNLTIEQWFNVKNWHNPNIKYEEGKTINEILSYPFGINYFKILLTQMPFWRR